MISASNFLVLVLLARSVSPADFGAFVLVYTMLLFANVVQFALITQPHNILAATRSGEAYIDYTSSATVSQGAFAAILVALALLAAAVAAALSLPVAGLLLLAAPTSLAWQFQEYFRRVLYTEERYRALVLNDVLSYGSQLIVVGVLFRAGRLSGMTTLEAVAASSALAALIGVWQIRESLRLRFRGPAIRENWVFGKWLLATPAYWLSTQLYLYAAAVVLGLAVAGALKAAQILMGPLHLLFAAFESVLPIRFARIHRDEGDRGLDAAVVRTFIVTVPIVAVYCLAVIAFAGPLLNLVYGGRYAGYALVLKLFALYYFALYVATILSARLRARQEVRPVFRAYLLAAAISVALLVMVPILHTVGALAGIVVGAIALSLFLWRPGLAGWATPAARAAPRTGG